MSKTPTEIMELAYENAKQKPIEPFLLELPAEVIQHLKIIVENAEAQKAVLGVTFTSLVYKVFEPSQDIRKHQDGMEGGYSGRTFDTKFITPFLKTKFPHFAMAESAWLTRSLEQPHPYNLDFPGKIRNPQLKSAFLNTLDNVEKNSDQAFSMLVSLIALMAELSSEDDPLFVGFQATSRLTITKITEAISQHIYHRYGTGVVGTARIPVLAIYSVYNLLMPDVKRYANKILAPLESHTSPDFRSKSLGDIDINNGDGSCFESIEIKHNKPITPDMIGVVYRKIKKSTVDRYYILTTNEPNLDGSEAVMEEIERYKKVHPCQIIVNGVIPSLKYYLRLISTPQSFVEEYTKWLKFEYDRASGIKREHLRVWQEICRTTLKME